MIPGLARAVDIDVAEHVDHLPVTEQLDGIVAIDVGRVAVGIGRVETKKSVEVRDFRGHPDIGAGGNRIGREGILLAVGAAAVIGRAETVNAQVGNVFQGIEFDCLGNTASQRTVDDARNHQGGAAANRDRIGHLIRAGVGGRYIDVACGRIQGEIRTAGQGDIRIDAIGSGRMINDRGGAVLTVGTLIIGELGLGVALGLGPARAAKGQQAQNSQEWKFCKIRRFHQIIICQ